MTASSITSSGDGSTFISQDHVDITLSVENQATSATLAQQVTSNSIQRILAGLADFNITNLQTQDISLQPVYNYTDASTPLLGFTSLASMSFTASPDIAGNTLDNIVKNGATSIQSVTLGSNKERTDAAYSNSLGDAANDAREKALSVAKALGLCLGLPLSINIVQVGPPSPTVLAIDTTSTSTSEETKPTIVPGNTQVTASVDITWQIGSC